MKEYAIGTYEIELLEKNDRLAVFKSLQQVCNYVDTAIDYDNDYVLPTVLNKNTKVISKISSCHYSNYDFFVDHHLQYLKRDKIDIMLIHSDRGDWKPLAKRMATDKRFEHIGISNFTAAEIQEYHDLTGIWPYAAELEINPYYIDQEAVDFCKQHGIKVIAYAIFGGKYKSWRTVADFGLGNILSYVDHYADITILRANSKTEADHFVDVVQNFDMTKADVIRIDANQMEKSLVPMTYAAPKSVKLMYNKPTYMREFGQNATDKVKKAEQLSITKDDLPLFEMLGDYKTYLRYKYNGKEYLGDWLKIGDNKYLAIYLWDKDGYLTKVQPDAERIEVWTYEL